MDRRRVAQPLLFLLWLVGSVFVIPLALRALGAPVEVGVTVGVTCLVLPLTVLIATRGAAQGLRYPRPLTRRVMISIAILWDVAAFVGAAVAALTGNGWVALALFYTGLFLGGAVVARIRSR